MKAGDLCRIDHKGRPGYGKHFGRARVVAVDDDYVTIQPFGRHRKHERVERRYVRVWRGK